jgi:hypothetical protein
VNHLNANLSGDLHVKRKGQLIQFSPYSTELAHLLENDVKISSYGTKTKYLNALVEEVLSIERCCDSASHIDELFRILALFKALPVGRIRTLAHTQHRNFDQMLEHLVQTALSAYPDPSLLAQDVSWQQAASEKNTTDKSN